MEKLLTMYTVEEFLKTCDENNEKPWEWDFKKSYYNKKKFDKLTSLEKVLRYKNYDLNEINQFNISNKTGKNADCDKEAFPIYKLLGWQIEQHDILRGEAMNSFFTTFRQGLQKSNNRNKILDELKIKSPFYPASHLNTLIDAHNYKKFDIIKNNFSEFEKFAVLTHTIGNFTVLPHWMNTGRYNFSQDYWDLTLNSLYTFLSPINGWEPFVKKYCLYAFVNEKLEPVELWTGHFSGAVSPDENQIESFLKNVNLRIEKRGMLLTKLLCKKINNTDFNFYEEIKEQKIEFSDELLQF